MTPRFDIRLRALPSRTPAIQRLRAFLKRAKRDWNLICERCVPISKKKGVKNTPFLQTKNQTKNPS
jgi:hypothetical protein